MLIYNDSLAFFCMYTSFPQGVQTQTKTKHNKIQQEPHPLNVIFLMENND